MDELEKVPTENVNLHTSVRTLCRVTDEIVSRTVSKYGTPSRDHLGSIHKMQNLNIFMTGFTGDVGGYMVRSLLKRNNSIYCIVRSSINPKMSAQQRFIAQCKKLLIFDEYYQQKKRIHMIEGDYFRAHLGINDKDWHFLANNVDVIVSIGCRVVLTMPWSKAVNGILCVTNYLLELSVTRRIKPILAIASSGSRVAMFSQPGAGMCRGYALAKYADLQRLRYFHYVTHHPMKLLFLGYLDRHETGPPNFNHVLHSMIWAAFKLNMFPNIDAWVDYANAQQICERSLDVISFQTTKLIYGAYAEKKDYLYFPNMFKLMKSIQPSLKLVDLGTFEKMLRMSQSVELGQGHKKLVAASDLAKECNLMYYTAPSNNIDGIQAPQKELFVKILRYIQQVPFQQFINRQAEYSAYFNYPWWDKFDAHVPVKETRSKL